ncbi:MULTISPECIES: NAD(P)-dependent oxidoreductase [Psychrilyobacter]|uniref:NAD(P)-dependent oxidoreductase n=1 Tax=Psychrilyobacter piezotolerans TaxID=2293438 RepID=A0ABX9KFF9_9FUSO|nr:MULTISPECIES: NAD(P)-binding domain-containing protein [Psychrilyobacter]MCS5422154.1 NAD(P)-binding domain-containing protein [Psychrilyobacter sp. S5]NDI78442.1 NAD(P)-dependent oxidoreductase [Psychrilyobacter piezotolerans]RDE60626.1 NAD(P)-dependent oxidoreductase [Psychrilyobacter sp. S5]REI40553.1 NAD(P)-dependent oxidoreductase [Psychrilyobacter piezotolerans]
MSKISVIGCGKMGSSLVKAFLKSGHHVFVYDVSRESCIPLVELGASLAETPIEAANNCDVMVFSINNYTNTIRFLKNDDVLLQLAGKTLVQLSTGIPQEAQELEGIIKEYDIDYIDGAIMCYPHQIGTEESCILISGNESTLKNSESALKSLTKNLMTVSNDISGASTLDCALLTLYYGTYWGILQAASLCKSQNFSVQTFADIAGDSYLFPTVTEILKHVPQDVESGNYKDNMASNIIHSSAIQRLIEMMNRSKIDTSVTESIHSLIQNAIETGYKNNNLESIVEIIRK